MSNRQDSFQDPLEGYAKAAKESQKSLKPRMNADKFSLWRQGFSGVDS
jgi:hypothetical protein